jgi:hypothetical protein
MTMMAATFPTLDRLLAYEQGETSFEEDVELFAELVKTGLAWQLQGSYGRMAADLIDRGLITPEGEIVVDEDGLLVELGY